MATLNTKSYCHDCGKEIEGENFYCEECLNKNGLNKFSVGAFIITLLQPIAGIFLYIVYNEKLNPGIHKGVKWGLDVFVILIVLFFIAGLVAGLLGYGSI